MTANFWIAFIRTQSELRQCTTVPQLLLFAHATPQSQKLPRETYFLSWATYTLRLLCARPKPDTSIKMR
jgi:hypothetical protein